ncbi:MAG TPA: toll/interleukin-1 receptor domain-containing protein [Thermoanaerobaculia bacterium]|jgi:hypothetical protein
MSGFVPGFENDLFISYAHADDSAWVQVFEKSLGEELSRRLGIRVSVWQDGKRLRFGQNWQTEIETGVQRSAVFVAVLSPSYEISDWCSRERRCFMNLFGSWNLSETSTRFFKVLKTPWENDGHRHFLPTIQTLDFFRREDGPGGDVEFLPGTDDFRKAIGSLARAIAQTLRRLRRERERVFVASPAEDCLDAWKQLQEELRNQGYDVQPPGRRDDAFADDLIRGEMEHALLSVHLLGSAYDPFTERQIRIAADLEQQGLMVWVWIKPGAEAAADTDQARLIKILGAGWRPDRPDTALPSNWMLLRDLPPRRLIDETLASLKPRFTSLPQPFSAGASHTYIETNTQEETRIASEPQGQIVQRMGLNIARSTSPMTDLLEQLKSLPEAWFEELVFRFDSNGAVSARSAPQAIRAVDLLRIVRSTEDGTACLQEEIQRLKGKR